MHGMPTMLTETDDDDGEELDLPDELEFEPHLGRVGIVLLTFVSGVIIGGLWLRIETVRTVRTPPRESGYVKVVCPKGVSTKILCTNPACETTIENIQFISVER